MIKVVEGDVCKAIESYIAHQTNCTGISVLGVAASLSIKFPGSCPYQNRRPLNIYSNIAIKEDFATPGTIDVRYIRGKYIINMFGQFNAGRCILYEESEQLRVNFFKDCLDKISQLSPKPNSIAMPYKIGCEFGGNWSIYYNML